VAGSAVRMHWPTQPFTRGSYTCYRPGQWSFWTLEGVREGPVHFCGEHTSPEFQGWMEGGAETGGRVAKEILDDFGIKVPDALAAVIDEDALLVGSEQSLRTGLFPRRLGRLMARG
jgi:monoamine oxidase